MNRIRPLRFWLVLACAATLGTTSALAQDDFVLEDEIALCVSCHGEGGVPIDPEYPIIFGQQYFYIFTQLRDYAAGRRAHDIMTEIASVYSRDQAKALATHFSEQTWPSIEVSTEEGDQDLAERGFTGGQCAACHSKWQGDSRIPRMAGQNPAYTRQTMLDFKHEARMNAPDKISTMKQLDDPTIDAIARYLGALRIVN